MLKLIRKKCHASKQPITLNPVNVNQILISDKFSYGDTDFKHFVGYKDDNIVRSLCIILSQMSGCIKYFDNSGKNMSLMIEVDSALVKCNDVYRGGFRVSQVSSDD